MLSNCRDRNKSSGGDQQLNTGPHVAFADAVAVDIAGQLPYGVNNFAAAVWS
jgi:hypothetical protein